MAVRIHVVGAWGATDDEFRSALDSIGEDGRGTSRFRMGSSDSWKWAQASVWHVNGADIDRALGTLSVPALRVTSSDGVLWMLTLTRPGKDAFHGVHHFTAVGQVPDEAAPPQEYDDEDFPEDELEEIAGINRFLPALEFLWDADEEARVKAEYAAEAEATVAGLDDYSDYGVSLPPSVIEAMKRDPHRAWHIAFTAHTSQMVEALHDYGFEIDRAALQELLSRGPLTEVERDSDLGNLPRFLRALGIEGVFREDEEQAPPDASTTDEPRDSERPEHMDWSDYPPGELFEKFEPVLAACPLSEITGGPVNLTHPALLHLLSHLLVEDPPTCIVLEFPSEEFPPDRSWRELNSLEVGHTSGRWQFCFETPHCWYGAAERKELETSAMNTLVAAAPEGTRVEIALLVAGLAEQCHRYAGTRRAQTLELDRAYPSLTAEVLNEALGLVDQVFGSKPIALASESEVDAVRRSYERAQGEPAKIRNGKIKPQYGSRSGVVQTLLFERFARCGVWDIAAAQARVEAEWQDYEQLCHPAAEASDDEESCEAEASSEELAAFQGMLQKMQEAAERLKQARTVPHRDEVLYTGRTGTFLRASLSDLPHVSAQSLHEHDAALESLGFRPLADSVGDVDQRQEITRCYAGHPEALSLLSHRHADNQFGWAATSDGAVSVDFSNGTSEFHTHFEDGSVLVTTSIDAVKSKPEVGIYVRSYEDIPIAKLWEKHVDGIRRFRSHKGTVPVDHTCFRDPAHFLARMDDLFCRFLGRQ